MAEDKLEPIEPTKHKTPKAVAKALLKLYRDPRRHAEGTYMRGVSGRPVRIKDMAVSCCILGGISLFMEEGDGDWTEDQRKVMAAFEAAADRVDATGGMVRINDTLGVEGIRKLLREVIKS